jgi:hypothetical protein
MNVSLHRGLLAAAVVAVAAAAAIAGGQTSAGGTGPGAATGTISTIAGSDPFGDFLGRRRTRDGSCSQ